MTSLNNEKAVRPTRLRTGVLFTVSVVGTFLIMALIALVPEAAVDIVFTGLGLWVVWDGFRLIREGDPVWRGVLVTAFGTAVVLMAGAASIGELAGW